MSIVSLLENPTLTGILVTLAAQLLLVSLAGVLLLKWLTRQSAPFRSLVCAGIMATLLLVFVASIGFQASGIAWHKSDLPVLLTPISLHLDTKPVLNALPTNASSTLAPRSTAVNKFNKFNKTGTRNSVHTQARASLFINAFGLIWAGGLTFLLIKLGYGLIFLQGFRFGLARVTGNKYDSLVKSAAGVFRKNRIPELYTSPKIESPITIGLLNPIVILPEKLIETLSENELKSILLHELAHIYHYDHVAGVIKRIVLAAHWWNPLVYRINTEHDMAREEVSDNYVLSELNPKEYSRCLADLAEKVSLISSFPAAAGMAGRRFDLVKRVQNILSEKRSLAMRTGLNPKLITFSVCAILTLFIAGLHGQVGTGPTGASSLIPMTQQPVNDRAVYLMMEGRNLTPEEATSEENSVAQNPDNLKAKTILLSYYFSKRSTDKTLYKKAEEIILWMIQNHPEAAVLGNPEGQLVPGLQNYTKGESLWEEQLIKNPNNLKILRNAGKYIMHSDLDLAISYFKKGKDLDPDNAASWDRELAQFYKLKTIRSSAAESQSLANESLKSFESAYAGSSQLERSFLVPNLAKAALTAGQLEKAAEYANQLLTTTATFNKGDMVYNGNFVLGMIAVKKGDIESAEKYLIESGETSGSPALNSFGPNMSLAKELLDRGKKDTVLAFLKKCAKFWNKPPSPCNQWIQELEEGQTPDFRRNLIY